jgi:hypothetical protein
MTEKSEAIAQCKEMPVIPEKKLAILTQNSQHYL